IMQWYCWHVAVKMSLGFLCLFLVFNTGKDNEHCLVSQQGKLFLRLFLHFTASCIRRENKKEKQVALLATAELPAKSVDLAAINLAELVNGMLNTALRGTKKLFSLLSVTSYSSFAFHKVSVTIYNISNMKNVDPGKFPMHYCYCLNNVTNDLTDFTALLVDIIGNSTSYLTEIFKSTSILSVRQSNDSDCIYICVMTGQTGRNLSNFGEMLEKSPVINYTFSSNKSSDLDLDLMFSSFMKLQEDPNKTVDPSAEYVWTFKITQMEKPADNDTAAAFALHVRALPPQWVHVRGTPTPRKTCTLTAWSLVIFSEPQRGVCRDVPLFFGVLVQGRHPFGRIAVCRGQHEVCAGSSPRSGVMSCRAGGFTEATQNVPTHSISSSEHSYQICKGELHSFLGCPQAILKESRVTSPPVTLIVQKINPCVMELCKFFQLCLCVGQRRYSRKEAMRYCVEYYSWFLKNASYICERVKRIAYSHTLKQKCLKNICTSV
ncbi:HHLA1 protein, partial [Circaetus pectoralis]|nr:HHLA1 protein [Circaetus pectoralis]